jgi:RsiW-degrading membrane proteinase PrsW (M82 family)/RNA polymerase subunit RPABC4/transcription elongation factor Spt4
VSGDPALATARAHPVITCHSCEREVPAGEYCGACGTHLSDTAASGADRRHAFAAHPGEQVLHLSVISTLFPHLPHRQAAPFRLAFAGATVVLVALGLFQVTGPAIAAAAAVVPLLFLLYLYEVEVYEDEPIFVIAGTFLVGALLGLLWALVTGPIVTQVVIAAGAGGPPAGDVLVAGVALPLAGQLLMLAGAAVMYFTRSYDEALDGFAFGAAGALGFTFLSTLVYLFPELQQGLFSNVPPVVGALRIVQSGILIPLIAACTTGLIAGALWLRRGKVRAHAAQSWTTSLGASIAVGFGAQVALGLVSIFVSGSTVAVFIYGLVAVGLLVWVRVALHHMLLSEAVLVKIGSDSVCTHCHRLVPRMAFCPHCGIATRATPKSGAGRAGRAVR